MKHFLSIFLLSFLITDTYSQIYRVGYKDSLIINNNEMYFTYNGKNSDKFIINDSLVTKNEKLYNSDEIILTIYKDSIIWFIKEINQFTTYFIYDSSIEKYLGDWKHNDGNVTIGKETIYVKNKGKDFTYNGKWNEIFLSEDSTQIIPLTYGKTINGLYILFYIKEKERETLLVLKK